jgi:ribonuclease-3
VTLGKLSGEIGFGKHMIISAQIELNSGRKNPKLLEDVFEAFLGAMFCDFNGRAIKSDKLQGFGIGYQVVEQWLCGVIETHLDFATMVSNNENGKERLIRYMQSHHGCHPRFVESHYENVTTVVLYKNDDVIAIGKASNRKQAEAEAVQLGLAYYGSSM